MLLAGFLLIHMLAICTYLFMMLIDYLVSSKYVPMSNEFMDLKWYEFDRFLESPQNHFMIPSLLNVRVNTNDLLDREKRKPIVDILYVKYHKANSEAVST